MKIQQRITKYIEYRKYINDIRRHHKNIIKKVPYSCACCELLGICRNPNNDYKCFNGCILLNNQRAREREKNNK
jgi:hypothetical protein